MKKKIYTGAYLLYNPNNKSQFGIVDAYTDLDKNRTNVRIAFGKQILEKITTDENEMVINLTLEECNKLSELLKTVENSIQLLINLSRSDKLKDEAYLIDP